MKIFRTTAVLGTLLLFGAAGCADLEVTNPNDPDREKALATAGDIEALIAGSFQRWWLAEHDFGGPALLLSVASLQHSSSAANVGMLTYSAFPRVSVQNDVTHADYGQIEYSWVQNYRALAAAAEGLRALQDPELAAELGATETLRARIFGRFVQGLAHASIALLYDRGYVIDETVQTIDENGAPILLGEPVGYNQMLTAAIGYFDQAIALSNQAAAAGIQIPADWTALISPSGAAGITMPELRRVINSYKARYRASVARTPQERAAVNWTQVLSDVGAGLHQDLLLDLAFTCNNWGCNEWHWVTYSATWQQATYFIYGMADQSGNYQRWLAQPLASRLPQINGVATDPVLIITPDLRFPQGTTLAQQTANRGRYLFVRTGWSSPDRGTWRWSYYANRQTIVANQLLPYPEIDYDEMRLLAAEAHFRMGQLGAAADSINVSRTFNGLNATDAAGTNTSCVPKLPNGTCGSLFEMLKWEKRLETWQAGPYRTTWYFDGRGWGDLPRGTPQQWPIPAEQASVLGLEITTYGGIGGQFSSPQSTYAWPGD